MLSNHLIYSMDWDAHSPIHSGKYTICFFVGKPGRSKKNLGKNLVHRYNGGTLGMEGPYIAV